VFTSPLRQSIAALISISVAGAPVVAAPALLQAPSAGQIDREIDRSLPSSPLPPVLPPLSDEQQPKQDNDSGQRIELKGVRFKGNQTLSDDQLEAALSQYIGQRLTITQLKGLADLLVSEYARYGYLASASLPPQDVIDGVIVINVQEARFAGATVDVTSLHSARIQQGIIESVFSTAQPVGEIVNFQNIERAELLLSDRGLAVSGGLQAGKKVGETAYGVVLSPVFPMSGMFSLDNQGSRSTGFERAVASIDWLSPMQRGDKLSLTLLKTEGTEYARLGYKSPIGFDGLTIDAQASAMNYEVIASDFTGAGAKGESQTLSVGLQYPMLRSRSENQYVSSVVSRSHYKNEGADANNYHLNTFSVSLSGNQYVDGRVSQYEVKGVFGNTTNNDQSVADTHGRFAKLGINLSTSVPVSSWNFKALIEGQVANKNLDSSQKMTLGGASGVRAYPESEGTGVNGVRIALDAEHQIAQGVTGAVFYDWGRIQQNDDNSVVQADVNVYSLSGLGASVSVAGPKNGVFKAIWARRIGKNPNPTADGTDQDGSLDKDRFWLSWVMPL